MKQKIKMVDITQKQPTERTAIATGKIFISKQAYLAIKNKKIQKGDPLTIAQIAGILAAKNVSHTIPLTHPINITHCDINLQLNKIHSLDKKNAKNINYFVEVISTVKITERTGPDIEAMYATSVCLLTIYDMIKPINPEAEISEIKLIKKTGGKSKYFAKK